jgi:hypothetical protein
LIIEQLSKPSGPIVDMRGVFTRKTQQTEEDRAVSYAHRDQIAVSRCVRDVAGTQKRCLCKRSAHPDQIIGAPRQHISPRNARSIGIRRRQQQLPPSGRRALRGPRISVAAASVSKPHRGR